MARKVRWAAPLEMDTKEQKATADTPVEVVRQLFARKLWGLMMQKGMNQSELGRAAGIARDSISTYVRAISMPDPVNLHKLAQALNVEVSELNPQASLSANQEAIPAIEVKQAVGDPGRAWLRCNVQVPFDVAVKVMALLSEAESKG